MSDFENISSTQTQDGNILNNRYELKKKIGEGSYGIVYKAKDLKNDNNLVAIKQVSKMKINRDLYLVEALKKELSIMHFISCDNSVKLIEDFQSEENYNFVMELCDSDLDEELKKYIKNKKRGFNELEVYEIMTQFNKVFLKMQEKNIIHRDLKLKNIMLKYNNDIPYIGFIIKLSDFGFSKFMDSDLTGTNLGSPATKAPEIMIGKDYNAKADLWSVGVIMFQLFYNRLPFPAKNIRELKIAIFNSNGVKLPENNNNSMSDICFSLINSLLQKEPEKRINFKEYFNHKFFSEEHRKKLIEDLNKTKEVEININEMTTKNEKEIINNDIHKKGINYKIKNEQKITQTNENKVDLEKRFKKLLKIEEYNSGYNLYKAEDILYKKNVLIKEISVSIIDNNERNKKIFDKEIKLLSILKGKKFPELIDLFKTKTHYNIVIEYFSGNNLNNFIYNHPNLDESLVSLILKQLKPSFIELAEKNIVLDFISPKNFAFTFYQNDSNFEIKFFDYGLNSIFYEEKYIKYYLLEEAELGSVYDPSINILSLGLVVYKMIFGEEALIKKNDDYEIKIKRKIKSEYKDNLKNFLSRCIKKEKRYKWEELFLDDYINFNSIEQKGFNNLDKKREPLIKDEFIEKMLETIIEKLNYIINYFDKLLDDKEHLLESEIYLNYYDDVITFLLFSSLECKTILKFLKIDADTNISKIDKTNQEIHLLKIYLNKNSKDSNKYDYSFINFVEENKNSIYLYNKENPTFEYYLKIFNEIEKKIDIIYNKFIGNFKIKNSSSNIDRSNSSSDGFESACSSILINTQEKAYSDNIDILSDKNAKITQEGNLSKIFMKCFEKGSMFYSFEERDKAIEELNIAKYLSEYIIFLRVILGNKDITNIFDKLVAENENINDKNESVMFISFIGGKIKLLKEKGILGYNCNESSDNLNDYNDSKIENIKIYDNMINFYPRIIQFIDEIQKEKK